MSLREKRPPFWNRSYRKFKEQKRKEFRAVIKAYEKFRRGCAYVPGYNDNIGDLVHGLDHWKDAMSVKNWGR